MQGVITFLDKIHNVDFRAIHFFAQIAALFFKSQNTHKIYQSALTLLPCQTSIPVSHCALLVLIQSINQSKFISTESGTYIF